jgi:hypothetical protein
MLAIVPSLGIPQNLLFHLGVVIQIHLEQTIWLMRFVPFKATARLAVILPMPMPMEHLFGQVLNLLGFSENVQVEMSLGC